MGREGVEIFVIALGISVAVAINGDGEVSETERKGLTSYKTLEECLDLQPLETDFIFQ